jgi:hypothetical protein
LHQRLRVRSIQRCHFMSILSKHSFPQRPHPYPTCIFPRDSDFLTPSGR